MLSKIAQSKEIELYKLFTSLDTDQIKSRRNIFNPFDYFKENELSLIAEIKRASPVKGLLCDELDPVKLARIYESNNASVISVITDRKYFKGDKNFIPQVKQAVALPVLRKDFIIHEIQIYESVKLGADLLLLIAALHDYSSLLRLVEKCNELGIEPLLEIHDKSELQMVLDLPVNMVEVNNRNLNDFTVNLDTSLTLGELIPDKLIKISASGISSPQDMALLKQSGFNGVLIGESLVRSANPGQKLQELLSYRELMLR